MTKRLIGDINKFHAVYPSVLHPLSKRQYISIIDGRKGSSKIYATIWHDSREGCYKRTVAIVELLNATLEID